MLFSLHYPLASDSEANLRQKVKPWLSKFRFVKLGIFPGLTTNKIYRASWNVPFAPILGLNWRLGAQVIDTEGDQRWLTRNEIWWTLFWFTSNQQQPVGCLEKPALLCGTVANLIETGLTNSFKCSLWLHLCTFLFLSAFWSFGKACLKEKVPWIPNFQLIVIEFAVYMGFWV